MKINFHIIISAIFLTFSLNSLTAGVKVFTGSENIPVDSLPDEPGRIIDDSVYKAMVSAPEIQLQISKKHTDSVINLKEKEIYKYTFLVPSYSNKHMINGMLLDKTTREMRLDSLVKLPLSLTDSLLYASNSLLIPLVYKGKELMEVWNGNVDFQKLLYGAKPSEFAINNNTETDAEYLVHKLRMYVRDEISRKKTDLFITTIDQLPDPTSFQQHLIKRKPIDQINVVKEPKVDVKKIEVEKLTRSNWWPKANMLIQFTQNYISPNWYQGGNSNLAILTILNGQMNYDNRKGIQWDNSVEWRTGFNSVDGDTLHRLSTNDDVLRYITKFGIKAHGNWYYTFSGDASTQLFDNFKALNSPVLKAKFLTPVRMNIGIGMDYKYKKLFSLMLAPVSLKYIYANDTVNVNPNLFGIIKGKNNLCQVGSSMRAQLNYSPSSTWQIDSRFTFYTDYKKVEMDWEIVNNFAVNRFFSTRLSLNPRYDNTVIMKEGEKAKVQFKQLLSIGFSYRFL